MKRMNYYGTILTEEYYILPEKDDHCGMPIIRTPVILVSAKEIPNWLFSTEHDVRQKDAGCRRCKSDTIFATISPSDIRISHWHCAICGWSWDAWRGIQIKPLVIEQVPLQLALFK